MDSYFRGSQTLKRHKPTVEAKYCWQKLFNMSTYVGPSHYIHACMTHWTVLATQGQASSVKSHWHCQRTFSRLICAKDCIRLSLLGTGASLRVSFAVFTHGELQLGPCFFRILRQQI